MSKPQDSYVGDLLVAPPSTRMQHTRLGRSGLKISKIVLGAMSFGSKEWRPWVLEEDEALPLLEYAYQAGINTWDTACCSSLPSAVFSIPSSLTLSLVQADLYSNGVSEQIIAKAIEKYAIPRENLVIMTKCRWATSPPGALQMSVFAATGNTGRLVNRSGLSRKHIFAAVQASVARLGTYIDVLQIQRMDPETPREETMRALNDVIEMGLVRYIGASSMPAWEFQALQNVAAKHGWHQFVSMQNYYNLLYREEEREMMPYCKDTGVGCIPWSPNARGILTRPWNTSTPSLRSQHDEVIPRLYDAASEIDKAIVETVEMIATERSLPMSVVAIAWCLSKGVNPIVGLNSKARIDEAVLATEVVLSDEEIARLEELYRAKAVTGY